MYFQCLKIFSRVFQRFPQIQYPSLYFQKIRLVDLGGVFFRRFGISSGTWPWEPKNMASGRIRPIGRLRVKFIIDCQKNQPYNRKFLSSQDLRNILSSAITFFIIFFRNFLFKTSVSTILCIFEAVSKYESIPTTWD